MHNRVIIHLTLCCGRQNGDPLRYEEPGQARNNREKFGEILVQRIREGFKVRVKSSHKNNNIFSFFRAQLEPQHITEDDTRTEERSDKDKVLHKLDRDG